MPESNKPAAPCGTVLFRIAQEALTNVARHAKASQVEVHIQCLNGVIRMEITDNGQGFEVDGMACANKKNRSACSACGSASR